MNKKWSLEENTMWRSSSNDRHEDSWISNQYFLKAIPFQLKSFWFLFNWSWPSFSKLWSFAVKSTICFQGWKDGISKAQTLYAQAKQMSYVDESLDADISLDNLESDYHSLQLAPRSPLATSSRASRVSSLAHSHR